MEKIKETSIDRVCRRAAVTILLMISFLPPPRLNAGFKDWLATKLPYKLPPEKLQIEKLRPSSAIEVLDRNDQVLFYMRSKPKLRFYKALSEISKDLEKFVVLSEDAKFYSHEGFDVDEIQNSIKANFSSNKVKRGGSTITQQLSKNLFLDRKRSMTRKLFEIPWTLQVERDLSKKQIIELYLNIIEWGPGIYGAEAASRHFFDKKAAELSSEEALFLAMIIPNPVRFDTFAHPKYFDFLESKKKAFVQRIYSEKKITAEEKDQLLLNKFKLAITQNADRRYPLQHNSPKYPGNEKEFQAKWGLLEKHILKNYSKNLGAPSLKLSLDKNFNFEQFQLQIVKNPDIRKKRYLIASDERGILGYKELNVGEDISPDQELPAQLRLEEELPSTGIIDGTTNTHSTL